MKNKTRQNCDHCHSKATHVSCVTCNRDMCEDCISYGDAGKVCGMCQDREDDYKRWERAGSPGDFDEWYDNHA